jgi:dipeptidyl-peptidase-4
MLKDLRRLVFVILTVQIIVSFYAHAQELTLESIYRYPMFHPNRVAGIHSMNDGIHYTVLENGSDIVKYSYETGKKEGVIFSINTLKNKYLTEISGYSFNEDETILLFASEQKSIYRYSYYSNYFVYDLLQARLISVFEDGKQQLATLSPNGLFVAFVYQNNLYIRNLKSGLITQITTDGIKNKIINGCPDWVYEEEFTLLTGYYWSPDSKKIAYYRFDETDVKEYTLTLYNGLYPELYTYKYPKAGEENARVDILEYDLVSGKIRNLTSGKDFDGYIPRIKWLPNSEQMCITHLNRLQNRADLEIYNVTSNDSQIFYTEEDKRYISELTDNFVTFIDSGRQALIMSEKSGFMHIYRYRINGSLINQVTSGRWEVDKLLGVDEPHRRIFYTSTEASPIERHIYSVGFDGTVKIQVTSGGGCQFADFSSTFNYYIVTSSDANTPYHVRLYNCDNQLIRELEDNNWVKENMKESDFVEKEFFSFMNPEGDTLYGYQILPPKFKKDKKYPVLVYVYGGPEAQMVLDQWDNRMAWFQLLAQKGYIVVCADNRGTDGRGAEFKKCTYLQLGKLETDDQIALARFMASKSYVDKSRIGIFGWSYGGYMSLLCLLKGNDVFKMGIAVAPVTSWRFYDTIYTERFMRTPQQNASGYDDNSPINYTNRLKGKLLLIHGTADDNVHLQNSMMLIRKLVEDNKQFEMQFYPDQNHNISGDNSTFHLYTCITDFILNDL